MLQNVLPFRKRSKILISITHPCAALYLHQNRGLCGTIRYDLIPLLKKQLERLQVRKSACEWATRESEGSDRLRWNMKSRLIGNGNWRWQGKKILVISVIKWMWKGKFRSSNNCFSKKKKKASEEKPPTIELLNSYQRGRRNTFLYLILVYIYLNNASSQLPPPCNKGDLSVWPAATRVQQRAAHRTCS